MKHFLSIVVLLIGISPSHAQSWLWVKGGGAITDPVSGNPHSETVRCIEHDANGNTYLSAPIGDLGISIDGQSLTGYGFRDDVLASYTCDGTLRWATVVGGPNSSDYIGQIKLDSNNDIYALLRVGQSSSTTQLYHFDASTTLPYTSVNRKNLCIAKYNGQNGQLLWYKFIQPDGQTFTQYNQCVLYDFEIDPDGTLSILALLTPGAYFEGQFNPTTPGQNCYILNCDSNGNFISAIETTPFKYVGSLLEKNYFFEKHPTNGNYYICGAFSSFNGVTYTDYEKFWLACLSPTGTVVWNMTFSDVTNSMNRDLTDFKIGDDGNLYLTGESAIGNSFASYTLTGTSQYDVPFALKLDPQGNLIWGTNATITPGAPTARRIDVQGNQVAVSPHFHGITWGGSFPNVPNSGTDASLFFFNRANGNYISNTRLASTGGSESFTVLTHDIYGNWVGGGFFEANISGGSNNLFANGGACDFFIAKYGYNPCTLANEEQLTNDASAIFPNPATTALFINTQQTVSYQIFNLNGKKVAYGTLLPTTPIPIDKLANGTYILQWFDQSGKNYQQKFIKI